MVLCMVVQVAAGHQWQQEINMGYGLWIEQTFNVKK
jgi:hypothetical protein